MTIKEASNKLGKSEKTIRRWIETGKLNAQVVDGKYNIDDQAVLDMLGQMSTKAYKYVQDNDQTHIAITESKDQIISELRNQLDVLRHELENAKNKIDEKDRQLEDSRQRQDTIIMQLTRQLGDTQKALEAHTRPWWRRLRLNKGKNDDKS